MLLYLTYVYFVTYMLYYPTNLFHAYFKNGKAVYSFVSLFYSFIKLVLCIGTDLLTCSSCTPPIATCATPIVIGPCDIRC